MQAYRLQPRHVSGRFDYAGCIGRSRAMFWQNDPVAQRRGDFFLEKTRFPVETMPLLDGLPSSNAERQNERRFQNTASPATPRQWHIKTKAKQISITALPVAAASSRREVFVYCSRTNQSPTKPRIESINANVILIGQCVKTGFSPRRSRRKDRQ